MKRLFQPVDNASLLFFRIIFGILALAEIMGTTFYYHWYKRSFEPDGFQFRYYGFDWVRPFEEPFMSLFFFALMGLAVLIILGKWYKWATTLFAFGFAYTFFLEKAHYLNHAYLFIWLCFVMAFLPANRDFSGDVLANPKLKAHTMPFWCLFLLRFLMGVVYFYGGLAKLNPDWLMEAQPLKIWLEAKRTMPVLGPVIAHDSTAWFMAYGGVFLDLFVVFFLLFKRTRTWAFIFVLFFHIVNLTIFKIGIFPWLSTALTALYFPPGFPRKMLQKGRNLFPFVQKIEDWWSHKSVPSGKSLPKAGKKSWRYRRPFVLAFLIPLMFFHLLYPFRHHLLEGDVAWTEEGHRYSWRMMLRSKRGHGTFTVVDQVTGQSKKVDPRDYLSRKQRPKLYTHPDMALQFAHFLAEEHQAETGNTAAVYADIRARLNQHPFQAYIDKTVNLAAEEWSFLKEADWIIPKKED